MQEARYAVEDIAASEEPSENLGVAAVNPFAAELPGVLALYDGKVVANIGAIKEFVDGRLQEKWLAEAEAGSKPHGGVRDTVCIDRQARACFTSVGEMGFVEHAVRQSAEPIGADGLNFGRAFDAVSRGAVGGHIEGFIGILGPVEIVGAEDLILGVQVVVDAPENCSVADRVLNGNALVSILNTGWERSSLEEVEKGDALAFRACANRCIIHAHDRSSHGAGWSLAAKKKSLSLMMGPPKLPPNWLRRKLSRGLPSDVAAVRASVRKYSKALP